MAVFKQLRNGKRDETYTLQFRFGGKEIRRNTWTADKSVAERMEKSARREIAAGRAAHVLDALDSLRVRRACCSIGQIIDAWEDEAVVMIKDAVQRKRCGNDLLLVLAHALDCWTANPGGTRGIKVGAKVPDRAKLLALPATVLTKKLVRDYYAARQGGALNWSEALEGNASINSTLAHARNVFSPDSLARKLEGLVLPDISGFLKEPKLPQRDKEPDPVREAEYAAMLAACDALPAGDPLRLVNMLLRQTGMRSASVAAVERDWLEDLRTGPVLHVRFVKGGTAAYSVPITEELAAAIRAVPAGPVLLPDGSDKQRKDLVGKRHNEWLKAIIGGVGERTQGNHRLRDTVASVLLSWLGIEAAVLALGHADRKVTLKHYGRLRMDVSEAMKADLRAFQRDAAAAAGAREGVVVPFRRAGER